MKQERRHRDRRRGLTSWAAGLLLMGTLAACGLQPGDGEPRPEAELVNAVDCTTTQPVSGSDTQPTTPAATPPAAGSVPATFVPVEAIRCRAGLETVEDTDGLWSAVTQERLTGDMGELLEALAEPSDGPGLNQACTADMELVPDLWLLDANGTAMLAAWPTDSCGKTKPGVHDVLAEMNVIDSSLHKIALIQPRAALDAGCPAEWSISTMPGAVLLAPFTTDPGDAAGSGMGETLPASPGLLPSAADVDTLKICHYQTAKAALPAPTPSPDASDGPPGDAQPASPFDSIDVVSGTFAGGGNLTGPAKDAVLQTAAGGPPAAECGAAATGFVVLWPEAQGQDAGAPLTVELDACRRLTSPDGAARTMPDELIAAIVAARTMPDELIAAIVAALPSAQ